MRVQQQRMVKLRVTVLPATCFDFGFPRTALLPLVERRTERKPLPPSYPYIRKTAEI